METDPYNVMGNVRARTANEMLHAFSHVARHERELELPIYAHHGTKDRLANLGVSHGLLPMTCCCLVWCIPITWRPLPWALHANQELIARVGAHAQCSHAYGNRQEPGHLTS